MLPLFQSILYVRDQRNATVPPYMNILSLLYFKNVTHRRTDDLAPLSENSTNARGGIVIDDD